MSLHWNIKSILLYWLITANNNYIFVTGICISTKVPDCDTVYAKVDAIKAEAIRLAEDPDTALHISYGYYTQIIDDTIGVNVNDTNELKKLVCDILGKIWNCNESLGMLKYTVSVALL